MMMCEECGKTLAVVHVEQLINGKKVVMNLCRECAEKKGMLDVFFQPSFSINNLLSAFLGSEEKALPVLETDTASSRCSVCGMTYRDFAKVGKLGCSKCYETFGDRLEPLLRRIHGTDRHVGKIPAKTSEVVLLRRELESLKKDLASAVSREEYEKAAEIRDEIRSMERKIKG